MPSIIPIQQLVGQPSQPSDPAGATRTTYCFVSGIYNFGGAALTGQ